MNIVGKIQNAANYILSEAEIEPYIRGMMLTAKRQRVPFKDIVRQMIDRNFYGSSEDYKNRLKKLPMYSAIKEIEDTTFSTIMVRATEIFPNLGRTI